MAWWWSDGFDLYALPADALLGYWDVLGGTSPALVAGRFSGSRGWQTGTASGTTVVLQKSSGSNDAVHHLVVAINQSAAISGTTNYIWFTLSDGATAQCSVVFRSDGAILLTSGVSTGTTLATYTGALTAINTWYAFEIEVVINNTTGSIAIRKNGNTSNDFSATSLNTRGGTANNYANRLTLGGGSTSQSIDDLLWRSDSAVPWVGDVRCYTRRPDTDAAAAWTRPSTFQMQPYFGAGSTASQNTNSARFTPFVSQGGTIGSIIVNLTGAGYTGNMKCAVYASTGGQPSTVIQSATAAINNPVAGANTFTFSPPLLIPKGTQFWVATDTDASTGSVLSTANIAPYSTAAFIASITYASFPVANPTGLTATAALPFFPVVTPTYNADAVSEPYEDAAASYVYSSTVGQSDLYTLTGIDSTPTVIIGVTTRALAQKSDAGTRIITADLQSGATKVSSSPGVLNSGVWGWVYRTDLTDPATGAAWSAVGVNNARVGVTVTS